MRRAEFVIFFVTYPSVSVTLLALQRSYESVTSDQPISEQADVNRSKKDTRGLHTSSSLILQEW
jgi:hypothetical protein